jgi:HSP20 family protein
MFNWPFSPEGWMATTERMFGREGLIRVEEFTDGDTEVVRAELPGIDPAKDVEVTVTDGMLSLRVERRAESREKAGDTYRSEFRYGAMHRTMPLPSGAKQDELTATYADGILEIRVPVTATPEPHRVEVKHA